MKAGRLLVLAFALGLVGVSLIGPVGVSPSALTFIAPLISPVRADPAPADLPPMAQDPKHPAAPASVPAFVPGHQTLTAGDGSSDSTAEPDGGPTPGATEEPAAAPGAAAPGNVSTTGSVTPPAPGDVARSVEIKVEPINAPASAPASDAKDASAKTASVDAKASDGAAAQTKVVWPEFIGAKNLFGAAKNPAPLAARAIGSYARGCLSGAVALPIDGPAWQEMRLSRNRNWGHPKLIALVEQFAKDAQKLDGWPGLLVGDIAQPRGGPMITGHASHQVGLDADIWLTPMPNRRLNEKEREEIQATSMLDKTEVAVDPKIFTDKQVALIKRAASYPEVERIFVHPAIKKALCKAAGTDRKWLGKVRPYWGHYYHFHVRIKCPEGFAGCTPQVPPTGDDGCGKEVDQWLAKVIPAKTPAVPLPPAPPSLTFKAPKPPKPPVMLSELPKECQALLAAGPDPVPVPKAALMTSVEVQKALAKAAAVNTALAKAAFSKGAKPTNGFASSAALRPHLKKTVAADKK